MASSDLAGWSGFALGALVLSVALLVAGWAQLAPLLAGPRAGRAALTLAVPLTLSVTSLCVLVPDQSASALGFELLAAGGLLGLVVVVWAGVASSPPDEPRLARPVTLVVVLLPAVLILVGGTALEVGSYDGLRWVFAATVAGALGAAVNAGLLIAERAS